MSNEINFFSAQDIDSNSATLLWTNKVANVIVEGTWDGATLTMQVQYQSSGAWVSFMTFTENDFAIIDNLLPGFNIRFNLADSGASTSITVNMLKA